MIGNSGGEPTPPYRSLVPYDYNIDALCEMGVSEAIDEAPELLPLKAPDEVENWTYMTKVPHALVSREEVGPQGAEKGA